MNSTVPLRYSRIHSKSLNLLVQPPQVTQVTQVTHSQSTSRLQSDMSGHLLYYLDAQAYTLIRKHKSFTNMHTNFEKDTPMSLTRAPSSQDNPKVKIQPTKRKRLLRMLVFLSLIILLLAAWQLLNNLANSTDPTVAGRPLSNPHTHLHTIALGNRPGVIYLGTHYGLFTSTDSGRTWPQSRGVLNTMMITSIAISPSNPNIVAVIAVPVSGIGTQSGIYFSHDGGNTLQAHNPPGLPLSAYPFTVQARFSQHRQLLCLLQLRRLVRDPRRRHPLVSHH